MLREPSLAFVGVEEPLDLVLVEQRPNASQGAKGRSTVRGSRREYQGWARALVNIFLRPPIAEEAKENHAQT